MIELFGTSPPQFYPIDPIAKPWHDLRYRCTPKMLARSCGGTMPLVRCEVRSGERERSLPGYLRCPRALGGWFCGAAIGESNIHTSWSTTIGKGEQAYGRQQGSCI